MDPVTLTIEMIVVLTVLFVTVTLFVTEAFRIDLTAILTMVALGLLSQLPGLGNLADSSRLFDGFASNAVISIIAVMIIGAGLDKTGLMSKVAGYILKIGGAKETRIVPIISGSVGVISSFMQNVGAAALFLPVLSRISVRAELPMSRLLMPMGFCAILGGTITMVGSSPLILLNDLMGVANAGLPDDQQMRPFELFDVTPIGLSLILTGILYLMLLGRWILLRRDGAGEGTSAQSMLDYVKAVYGLKAVIFEVKVPEGNILIGHRWLISWMRITSISSAQIIAAAKWWPPWPPHRSRRHAAWRYWAAGAWWRNLPKSMAWKFYRSLTIFRTILPRPMRVWQRLLCRPAHL